MGPCSTGAQLWFIYISSWLLTRRRWYDQRPIGISRQLVYNCRYRLLSLTVWFWLLFMFCFCCCWSWCFFVFCWVFLLFFLGGVWGCNKEATAFVASSHRQPCVMGVFRTPWQWNLCEQRLQWLLDKTTKTDDNKRYQNDNIWHPSHKILHYLPPIIIPGI